MRWVKQCVAAGRRVDRGRCQLFEQVVDLINREAGRSRKAGADNQEVGTAVMTLVANLAVSAIRTFCEDPPEALTTFAKNISWHLEDPPLRPPFDDRRETKH